jgi:hypothetical protein
MEISPPNNANTGAHPAEANQLRSRYLAEERSAGNNTNSTTGLRETEPSSYGIIDRWRSYGQRISSSFAVANSVEEKRLEGFLVVDEEERDTKLERVFDVLLAFPLLLKRPRFCGQGRVATGSFALLQLLQILFIFWFCFFGTYNIGGWYLIPHVLCQDEIEPQYNCPLVQNRLHAANLTFTSDVDAQMIHSRFLHTIALPRWGGQDWEIGGSVVNHSNFWTNTLSEEERDTNRFLFMIYRRYTVMYHVIVITMVTVGVLAVVAIFKALHVSHNNNNNQNVLYPAVLVCQNDGKMQFVRRRRYVRESLVFAVPISIIFSMISTVQIQDWAIVLEFVTIVSALFVGFSIQKDNVTALSVSLSKCTTAEDFVHWKSKLYKPTVALLHSWSRRLSMVIVAFFAAILSIFISYSYQLFIGEIQLEQQEGTLSETVRSRLRERSIQHAGRIFVIGFIMLAFVVGLSLTSMYYNGLKNVFASLELPDLQKHFYVKDFEYLQDSRGAFTVLDFPVTLSLGLQLLQFVFVSTVTGVISLAYLSPYY